MQKRPLKFYRLWCGRKRYSGWLPTREQAGRAGLPHGVTYEFVDGSVSLGPLAWIEEGTRKYARSRTIPKPRPQMRY